MKCDFPIELLSGYLDGELDEKQRARAEKHLGECPRCNETIRELKLLDDHIRAQEFEEPSRDFIFGLNRRIIEKIKKKRRFFVFRYTPVFVPAAVALLIFVVLININQQQRMIEIDDRILYAEIAPKQELELQLPAPKIAKAKEVEKKSIGKAGKRAGSFETAPASEVAKTATADERADELVGLDDMDELRIPKDRITRAIIDSTGLVLKVATGNSIIPEKDTVLENSLQGQQLTPPTVGGRRTQMYVDLTPVKEDDYSDTK